jgi:hypothetical protein
VSTDRLGARSGACAYHRWWRTAAPSHLDYMQLLDCVNDASGYTRGFRIMDCVGCKGQAQRRTCTLGVGTLVRLYNSVSGSLGVQPMCASGVLTTAV